MTLMQRRRALMMAKGGTPAQDYVRQGLLLWLDGEKNSTDGAHTASLSTWVDQSGNGRNFTATGSTNILVIGNNYVEFGAPGGKTQFQGPNFPSNGEYVEIVMEVTNTTNNAECVFVGAGTKNLNLFWKNGSFGVNGHTINTIQQNTVFSFTSNGYYNGETTQNTGVTATWTVSIMNIAAYTDYSNYYQFHGRIYAIRVYDHVLSDAERQQNLSLDMKRFGIEVA